MNIQVLPLATLIDNLENPRVHTERDIEALRASIRRYGPRWPILIDTWDHRMIVAGHGRRQAAVAEGYQEWPCIDAGDLSAEEIDEFTAVDNRVAELSFWDEKRLATGFKRRGGREIPGFTVDDIQRLEAKLLDLPAPGDDDAVPDLPAEPTSRRGDVYLLGRHRVVCGDAQSAADWTSLMGQEQADLCWTDPPYNVDYVGKTDQALKIENDKMDGPRFLQFLTDALSMVGAHTRPGGAIYVCHADTEGLRFRQALSAAGFTLRQVLCWVKDSFVMGRQDYQWRHEPILYGWRDGGPHKWYGGRTQDTVIECPRPKRSTEHPTMKPVALVARLLKNSSQEGALVVDPFGGSGSTLIACERTRRTCCLMELDPRYVDVVVQRWEQLTGQRATKLTLEAP